LTDALVRSPFEAEVRNWRGTNLRFPVQAEHLDHDARPRA